VSRPWHSIRGLPALLPALRRLSLRLDPADGSRGHALQSPPQLTPLLETLSELGTLRELCISSAPARWRNSDVVAIGRLRRLRTLVITTQEPDTSAANSDEPLDLSPLLALTAIESLAIGDSLRWTEAALQTAARLPTLQRLRLCLHDGAAAGCLRLLAPLKLEALSLGFSLPPGGRGGVLDGLGAALPDLRALQLSAPDWRALREAEIGPLVRSLADCKRLAHLQLSGSHTIPHEHAPHGIPSLPPGQTMPIWASFRAALAAGLPAGAVLASNSIAWPHDRGTGRTCEAPGPLPALLAWTHSIDF
jgi:hypothetical protein